MEIKKFNEFIHESQELNFESDYNYDELDESLMNAIKGAFSKPNYKDPKTAKDFGGMVEVVTSKFPSILANSPILVATKLVNLLTMFLNKQGPFKNRSGAPVPKPLPMLDKGGAHKTGSAIKAKPVAGAKPVAKK